MQWLWVAILLGPVALENNFIRDLIIPQQVTRQTFSPSVSVDASSIIQIIFGVVVTGIVLAVTAVILVRLPKTISNVGHAAVHNTATAALPMVTHHKKLSEPARQSMIKKLEKYIKFMLCVLPFGLVSVVYFVHVGVSSDIAILIGSLLAITSLVWFSIEYKIENTKVKA